MTNLSSPYNKSHFLLIKLIALLIILSACKALAQRPMEVLLNFSPPYPREISAYFNNPANYSLTVINHTDADQEVYFLGELVGVNNGVYVSTINTFKPLEPIVIPGRGVEVIDAEMIANISENITGDDLIIEGIPGSELNINGMLPEGQYAFCINAYYFAADFQPLSVGCSQVFDIYYGDQITIMDPYEGEVIPSETGGVFNILWNHNLADPDKIMDLEYQLKMIDLTDSDGDYEFDFFSGGIPPMLDITLDQTNYIYNGTGTDFELEEGRLYGIRVQAIDPFNEVQFANNGYSEIRTFWYGYNGDLTNEEIEEEIPPAVTDCVAECEFQDPISTTLSSREDWETIQISYFQMTNIDITANNGGILTGTGTIQIPWLNNVNIAVAFNNLQVNTAGRVFAGTAYSVEDDSDELNLSDLQHLIFVDQDQLPPDDIAALSEQVTTYKGIESLLGEDAATMPIGFKEYIQGREFTFAIMNMEFSAASSSVDMLNISYLGALGEDTWLALAGSDFCLTPGGIGGEGMMNLAADLSLDGYGDQEISFKGSNGSHDIIRDESTYMEWDCDGLLTMALRGEVLFDRNTIVPDDNGVVGSGKAKGSFEMVLDRRVSAENSEYAYREEWDPEGMHLMLGFDMDPFQIPGLEGWSFEDLNGYMDLSDLENPQGIRFPDGHDMEGAGDLGLTWQGFYIHTGQLKTPSGFTKNGTREGASLDNILLETGGLTMDINVTDLIDVNAGQLDGWGFSLDTFRLSIIENTLTEGRMMGTINPPILGGGDFMKYMTVIDKNENDDFEFYAIATPDGLVDVPITVAKAALCPNSYISFTLNPDETKVETFLKGQMVIDVTENLPADFTQSDIIPGLQVRLADFQLNYNSQDGFLDENDVNDGTGSSLGFGIDLQDATCGELYTGPVWEFEEFEGYEYDVDDLPDLLSEGLPQGSSMASASPQENVDGFPISINDVTFGLSGQDVNIDFDVDLSLSGGPLEIMVGTRLRLNSQLNTDADGLDRFSIKNLEILCGSIGDEDGGGLSIAPFTLKGEVCLIENEDGSKGFTADDVELGLGVVNVQLSAGFGKSGSPDDGAFGTEDYYGWWYVDGMLRFAGGIPLGQPFVRMNGFGGGVYWNVDEPSLSANLLDGMMAGEVENDSSSELEIETTPSFGTKSFVARTSLSVVLDQLMIVDPFLSGTWQNNSLSALSLGGDFWMLAPTYDLRDMARMNGNSVTTLTFQDVNGSTKVAVSGENNIYADLVPGVIYGAGPDKLLSSLDFVIASEDLVDHESNDDDDNVFWYFNAGNPYEGVMGGVKLDVPGFNLDQTTESGSNIGVSASAEVLAYAMIGQNIPTYLPPPPDNIADLSSSQDDGDSKNSGEFSGDALDQEDRNGDQAQTGNGLVFGVHASASTSINAIFYASLAVFAGVDVQLVQLEDNICYTDNGGVIEDPGINGWYGQGRAYAGMEGKVGVKGKLFGKEIDIVLMQLLAAVMLEAGGPEPLWMDGRASLSYSLLGGAIKGNARMAISVGEKCVPPTDSPFDFPIIADTYPNEIENRDIDPYVSPTVAFTVAIGEEIEIPGYHPLFPWQQHIYIFRATMDESEFVVEKDGCTNCNTPEHDNNYDMLIEDNRVAQYNPLTSLSGNAFDEEGKDYKMKITVRAEVFDDWNFSNGKWVQLGDDLNMLAPSAGDPWEETREIAFTTTPLPARIEDDQVGKTKPFRNQKFFMLDEMTNRMYIHTRNDETNNYFMDEHDGIEYNYEVVIREKKSNDEVYRAEVDYDGPDKKARWDKPLSLDKNTEYLVQIIRKREFNIADPNQNFNFILKQLDAGTIGNVAKENFNDYVIEPEVADISNSASIGPGEELIYDFIFETSNYATLEEKLAAASINIEYKDGYQSVQITGIEGFDTYDIDGKDDDDPIYSAPPKVIIEDPLTSDFMQNTALPLLTNFVETWEDDFEGNDYGLYYCMDADMEIINDALGELDNRINGGASTVGTGTMEGTEMGNTQVQTLHHGGPYGFDDYPLYNCANKLTIGFGRLITSERLFNIYWRTGQLEEWTWDEDEDGYNDIIDWEAFTTFSLNEHVTRGSILKEDEEDDNEFVNTWDDLNQLYNSGSGPLVTQSYSTPPLQYISNEDIAAGGQHQYTTANDNVLKIKYYLTEYVLEDAEIMVDAAEEEIDLQINGNLKYSQENPDYVMYSLLADMISVQSAIMNSSLYDNVVIVENSDTDFNNNSGMTTMLNDTNITSANNNLASNYLNTGFSNSIKLTYNRSFEQNGMSIGSSKVMNFEN